MAEKPMTGNVESRPNRHPFAYSFGVAGVTLVVLLIIGLAVLGSPSNNGLGYTTGRLTLLLSLAAIVAALIARSSAKEWTWLRYTAVVVPIGVLLFLFSAVG